MTPGWRLALPLSLLTAIHMAAIFGDFIAPNSPLEQNRMLAWAPPMRFHIFDPEGHLHLRPFVYSEVSNSLPGKALDRDSERRVPLKFFVRGDKYKLAGFFETDLHLLGLEPPDRL